MIEGLKDKVVIVTGGGHGIGRAYCLGFGGAGAKVVVADIDEPASVKVAKEVNSQTDAQSLSVKVDVANEASTQEMVRLALDRFGKVDILVNNAAIFATIPMNRGGIDSIDPAEWEISKAFSFAVAPCCRPCASRNPARSSISLRAQH
jgi:3-oxoacyl-[acyl-carrier protein] reductase